MVNSGDIRCDRCGAYGSPHIHEKGIAAYKDFSTSGEPIFISMIDDSGQLCGACFKSMGVKAKAYLEAGKKYGR